MLKASAQEDHRGIESPALLVTIVAAACSFGAFFAFVGWYDETGGRGWKGFAIPVLVLLAGQGLGFPQWTWRGGVRLALAGAEVLLETYLVVVVLGTLMQFVAYVAWLLLLLLPGAPIGFAYGRRLGRTVTGVIAGIVGFNVLTIAGLAHFLDDLAPDAMFPAPGIRSLGIWGTFGGAVLAFALTRDTRRSTQPIKQPVWGER